jgi:putative transcriptional regulator
MKPRKLVLGFLLAAMLQSAGISSPQEPRRRLRDSETLPPDKGIFLVAKPGIARGPFHKSVVLLLTHDKNGTLGLIVNRATEIPLAEAAPDLKGQGSENHKLFFGGPVVVNAMMFLVRSPRPLKDTNYVMGDVYFSTDRQTLEKLLKQEKSAKELRLYMGHSGWAPGQLESEIKRDDWELIRADAETVFESDLDEMWRELFDQASSTIVAESHFTERLARY